jgi:hypothetical protein
MNIIFGREQAELMGENYTILELDTFKYQGQLITAFCAVDQIPITDMPKVESMKELHQNLLIEYRKGDWNYCEQALEHLTGFWNHELETFYANLATRISKNKDKELEDGWWIIDRNDE